MCVIVFALTACFRFLALVSFSNDEYVNLAGAQQMLFGEWPTRDFFDPGLPLAYAASAGAQLVFGRNLFAEAMLTAGALALGAALTVVAAKRVSGSLTMGVVAALFEVTIFPRGYAYPEILLYAAAPLVIWWYQERTASYARTFALAAFVQVAFLFRHDHGLFIGTGAAVAAALGSGAPSSTREVARRLATFAALAVAAATPYIVYLSLNGGIVRYLAQGIAFSAAEAAGNHLTVPALGPALGLQRNSEGFLFFLFYLLPLIAAVVLCVTARGSDRRFVFARVAPLIVIALLVDRAFLRDELSTRLANAVVPAVLLFAWLAGETAHVASARRRAVFRTAALIAVLLSATAVTTVGATREQLNRASLFGGLRKMPGRFVERSVELHDRFNERQMPSRAAAALVPFFKYVDRCTTGDQRLLLPGFIPEVAVYAERPFAGGRSSILQGFIDGPDGRRQIQQRLETQTVPFVVVTPNFKTAVWAAYPELAAFVKDRYRPLVTYKSSDGGDVVVEVFVSQTLASRASDPATGWPCFR